MKKLSLIILTLCVFLTLAACGGDASTTEPTVTDPAVTAPAKPSEGLEFTLRDGNYYIVSGIGTCTDTDIVIPDTYNGFPVTAIGDAAFYYCTSLSSVIIPNSITTIGDRAFHYCPRLTSVTIPNSVLIIGDGAFYSCDSLTGIWVNEGNPNYSSDEKGVLFNKEKTSLIQTPGRLSGAYVIPDSVTTIGEYGFSYCHSLTSVTIPNSVTTIGDLAFLGCDSLTGIWVNEGNPDYSNDEKGVLFNREKTSVIRAPGGLSGTYIIPDNVTTIDYYAFSDCTSLTSAIIGDSVTTIDYNAFSYCTNLISVIIGDSVATIEYSAFEGCDSLTGIWVNEGNPNYSSDEKGVLFNKNKTTLIRAPGGLSGTYIIPDSVTIIGGNAFSSCNNLAGVTIPNSVIIIDYDAFARSDLISVNIPDSVTTIDRGAFQNSIRLTSVSIGESVTTIGDYAFLWCNSLTDVYYSGARCEWNRITVGEENECLLNANIHFAKGEHDYDDGVETKAPTCAEAGIKTYTCTCCGDSYTEEIEQLTTHSYDNGTCTICGVTDPDYVMPN